MVAELFKDFGKTAGDTLRDDYDFSRKLKIKTKAENGVVFTTEGAMNDNNSILAKVGTGFTHEGTGIICKKLQISSQGRLVTEAEAPNVLTKGLKLTFKLEDGSTGKTRVNPVGVLGAEYKQQRAAFSTEADFISSNVRTSLGIVHENFLIGGRVAFNVENSSLVEHNVGASFVGSDFATTLTTMKNFTAISASFHHRLSKDTIYAGVLDYDLKTASNTLTVGGRYRVDADTTFAGKVNSNGFVALAALQKVRPSVTLSTSVHFDAKNLESNAHKFGVGLTLG
uniref:Voltagedependent anionselective channel protein puta n=1 Tax=Albugo laibachii Nc14 TaxID=890382 RepID=F0WZY9_9STRA|nr:voltagedependent anionselective channel protein puta [Albugo laibachii Nc14]|eukprot:CCA27070.1 voltagedependent anionselective channel protein puta [Albugo laibachii Nc14]